MSHFVFIVYKYRSESIAYLCHTKSDLSFYSDGDKVVARLETLTICARLHPVVAWI